MRELYKAEYDNLSRDEFLHKFGMDTKIIIEHVAEITREKSGKFKLIKNNINIGNELVELSKQK